MRLRRPRLGRTGLLRELRSAEHARLLADHRAQQLELTVRQLEELARFYTHWSNARLAVASARLAAQRRAELAALRVNSGHSDVGGGCGAQRAVQLLGQRLSALHQTQGAPALEQLSAQLRAASGRAGGRDAATIRAVIAGRVRPSWGLLMDLLQELGAPVDDRWRDLWTAASREPGGQATHPDEPAGG